MQKYNFRHGDVVSGAVLAALGVYIVLQARAWNYYGPDGPGPGFFPTWYGLLMVSLALLLVGQTVWRTEAKPEGAAGNGASARALVTWLAFAIMIALMVPLGFLISFTLFTFFLVAFIFQRSLLTAGLTAVGTSLAFHLTFPIALGVSLPTGVFGF